jgi:hypothetical protein
VLPTLFTDVTDDMVWPFFFIRLLLFFLCSSYMIEFLLTFFMIPHIVLLFLELLALVVMFVFRLMLR